MKCFNSKRDIAEAWERHKNDTTSKLIRCVWWPIASNQKIIIKITKIKNGKKKKNEKKNIIQKKTPTKLSWPMSTKSDT